MAFFTALLRRAADDGDPKSLSRRLRERRFRLFESLVASLEPPVRMIDVGGTNGFWEGRGWADREGVEITLVNLRAGEQRHSNIIPVAGDAADLSEYRDASFDVAFSNSVIEHLFTLDRQEAMARELRRVAPAYWVQTPSYWFPIEPHFLVPAWHWLPKEVRVRILLRTRVGWVDRCASPEAARDIVEQIRLLRRKEVARLFPEAQIVPERFFGVVKSWIAIAGFRRPVDAART
jgi:hypothetical protein